MRLTPLDIIHQEFKKSFHGYNEYEVNEFLERLAKDYEELIEEVAELKGKNKILEEKLSEYTLKENALQNSLILAEKTAEERIESAKKEAELIIDKAKLDSEKEKEETEKELKKVKEELSKIKAERDAFIIEYESMLKAHLKILEERSK